MRILVEPMGYHLLNLGDVAMRQVAVGRLDELWPDAEILMFADDATALAAAIPRATPISTDGRWDWFYPRALGPLRRRGPNRAAQYVADAERRLKRRHPHAVARVVTAKRRATGRPPAAASDFLDVLFSADLLVVSGAGALNDDFAEPILTVLDAIEMAVDRGTPCAMMGQGIGPITERRLLNRMRAVLPRVGLIALREDVTGRSLVTELGVPADRVVTTGDDAVELAYEHRRDSLGDELGLNVRVAGYAPLSEAMLQGITAAVRSVLDDLGCVLLPLPMSRHGGERDLEVVLDVARRSGARVRHYDDVVSPADLLARVGRCRVVVTGSYHAAVFALSQGIPTVCLVSSPYYRQKFIGLAALFGAGCRPVATDGDDSVDRLVEAVREAWTTAEDTREQLLEAARAQIEWGRSAYGRLREIVEPPA